MSDVGIFIRKRIILPADPYVAAPTPGTTPYVGPGDVATAANWKAFWGVRAFTLASIGGNIIRLRRTGDNAELDFAAGSDGALDQSAIATWIAAGGAGTGKIVTFYDQSGNGNHVTQSTTGVQPAFTASAVGGRPSARFGGAHCLAVASFSPEVNLFNGHPIGMAGVVMSTGTLVSTQNNFVISNGGTLLSANVSNTPNQFRVAGSAAFTASATDGVYHTALVHFTEAGTGTKLYIDGSATTGDAGANGALFAGSQPVRMGANSNDGTSQPLTGDVCEFGIYDANLDTFAAALDANQGTYYTI